MSAEVILRSAKRAISKPKNWTQEAIARDSRGNLVDVLSDRATCFCMIGAIQVTRPSVDDYAGAISFLRKATGVGVYDFNDSHGHKAVLAAFDKAIEIAEMDA
ncbi:DUF6197 family protein [Agrobacterium rubi]|uniref:DUF6197 family protein n=1 Tax=Agrobacterium rubi TaxID=28099 RepID=UPI001574EC6B|nr:hypothetical protein [Agrobacterium rubi]NTE87235.1 hypothetical protein [Agrobacterium rubi]NTF03169.1 hypothetical protein [Agrobacterium rubi]